MWQLIFFLSHAIIIMKILVFFLMFHRLIIWVYGTEKTLRKIYFCAQLSKQLNIKIWKQNDYWLLNMSVMNGIWGNSLSYVHGCDDNSYFNIDGKHFHTKICIEKKKTDY